MSEGNAAQREQALEWVPFIHRILFLLGVVVTTWFVYQTRQVVLLGLTSVILAVVLGGLATQLNRLSPWRHRKWSYRVSVGLVLLSSVAILAAAGMSLGPRIGEDLGTLRDEIPKAVESLQKHPLLQSLFSPGADGAADGWSAQLFPTLSSTAISMAVGVLGIFGAAFLVLFVTVFLAVEPNLYKDAIVSMFPVRLRSRASQVLEACARGLWRWLLGQAFAMLLIGTLTTLGLYLVGMEFALTLGIMAGLLQFIPYIGPYLSAVPAVLVAVTVSPQLVISVIVLYFVIQVVESNFITPFVLQKNADLPPAFTLLSTVVFGVLFGPIGVIVATPLAVLLLVLYQELYQRGVLGMDIRSAGSEETPVQARFRRLLSSAKTGGASPGPAPGSEPGERSGMPSAQARADR